MPAKTPPRRKASASPAASSAPAPQPSRPVMKNYGIAKDKKGLLDWEWAAERLRRSRNYWVATTRPDGRPHVMPVWGFWTAGPGGEERLYFGSDNTSRKARNLAQSPAITVHLESGDEAVILEGRARPLDVRGDPALLAVLDQASRAKYKMPMFLPPTSVVYTVDVRKAFAWREKDFPQSATRWLFPGAG